MREFSEFYGAMKKNDILTILGFALFITGFTSLTLTMVGLRWSWLSWIDDIGSVFGFVVKILMAVFGIALVAYIRTDYSDIKRAQEEQGK